MYLEYWGLKENPFENTPDPRFLYPSTEHRQGLQKLLYAISAEKGCALLTGEYGCGKTLLARTVVDNLDLSLYDVALINYPIFDRENFLKEILSEFGRELGGQSRVEYFRELSRFFYENVTQGKKNVLIIDEAQIIEDPHVFEEIRLLLNIQLEDRFLVNILLVGQPELREKIMTYPQLEQRIAVKFHLHRFDQANTTRYIQHRLQLAGAEKELFSDEAYYLIFKISHGIPRRINNLADSSLLEGASREVDVVDKDVIQYVV